MDGLGEDTVATWPNIVLNYPLIVNFAVGEDQVSYFSPDGAEFFVDEHDLQWVKFKPSNGYQHGKEHMVRTDIEGFMIVKDEAS